MRIASWNVNSIKARLGHVQQWLATNPVDVLLLQEIKCEAVAFPTDALHELGFTYQHVVGEKSYNGVAMLSRHMVNDVITALPGDDADMQSRFVGGCVNGVLIYNLYAPNGNPRPGPKFDYKLNWLKRLRTFAAAEYRREAPVLFAGDYNIIPTDTDVKSPAAWRDDALFQPESQQAFFALCHLGYTDAWRALQPNETGYTFWDYRAGAWQKNDGIRIDHILLSPEAADRTRSCHIDSTPRGWDTPSDHVPIVLDIV
jgi:exodeoxyribonuclease-3